jgi:pimeloyl-ACP methyl ester carboxylesterase
MIMTPNVIFRKPSVAKANGLKIAYEQFGNPDASPLLLILGLGDQMFCWDQELCEQLAARGYRVIRFDNRDVGLSTSLDHLGVPDIPALKRLMLLDFLNIESAHIVGRSMGGMIGQMMAVNHPARVKTLTSLMSSTSDTELPPPKPEVLSIMLEPVPTDLDGFIEHSVRVRRIITGPGFQDDENRVREWAHEAFIRGINPDGTARQFAAIIASGSRKEALKSVTVSSMVIHGDSDPLVPVECGIDTANAIPGAKLIIIKGLGHTLVPGVYPQIVKAISQHAVNG